MAAAKGFKLADFLNKKEILDIFFWQTLGAILNAALAPEIAALQQESFRLTPTLVLGAAELADAVVRGHMTREDAEAQARQGGLTAENFGVLLDGTGQPPDFQTLAEAWRRGVIEQAGTGADSTSLEQGIRESRLKNKWIAVLEKLQFRLPDPGLVIEGWLRAQITEAEARAKLYQAGLDAETQTLMYNASGRPPGPGELADMFHRGIIPESGTGPGVLSLEQGFKETDLKDKWLPAWKAIQAYLPPPRTVTAMVREGALDDAAALRFFKSAGLSEELAAAYLAAAHHQAVAADKDLTKADVLSLYGDRLISSEEAKGMLAGLGYAPANAQFLLDRTDFAQASKLLQQALSKLRALYLARKLDKATLVTQLGALGVPAAAQSDLLNVWNLELEASVAILTAAEIADAVFYQLIGVDEGLTRLQGLGFSPRDAWIRLGVRLHGAPTQNMPPA